MTAHADRDRSEQPATSCTCAIPCNTAHDCSNMPKTAWLSDDEIAAAAARYLDAHPDERDLLNAAVTAWRRVPTEKRPKGDA